VLEPFRGFVRAEGAELPADAPIHELLELAWARWGPEGFYTVAALHSGNVRAAAAQLNAAARLLTDR